MSRTSLVLFTASYPYTVAAETTFLPPELERLCRSFRSILIVPAAIGGRRDAIDAPNVRVDDSYARFIGSKARLAAWALRAALDAALWRELLSRWRIMLTSGNALARAVHAIVLARMTERWLEEHRHAVRWDDAVLYSWWFDGITLGLAWFGRTVDAPVVTRAHGRDLYEERQKAPYLPFRAESLARVTRVFSVSDAGARYLARRYPAFADRVAVARIGIDDPAFLAPASADGVFRVVSCSFLLPVKRVDLMARGIAEAGRMLPGRRFAWTHIGDGAGKAALASLAGSVMPPNVSWSLPDYPGRQGLNDYYRTHPIDVFMNTSASEGTPVGIMEAISVGIPVLATAVGGNPEIVGPENGALLPADPTPAEIGATIVALAGDPQRLAAMRTASRTKWEAQYSAASNYRLFAETIKSL